LEFMVKKERREELSRLQKTLGYSFKEIKLLNKALTHKSYVNETGEDLKHNERFEFLGDSVLDLMVSEYMVLKYSDYKEGVLSKIRAGVVNESCLAKLALNMDLGAYLLLGRGEEMSGGRKKASLLANAYEALAGAIYFDSSLETAAKILLPSIKDEITRFIETPESRDYKSDLQEYTQNKMLCIPVYKVIREVGPDHEKQFEVGVSVKDTDVGKGMGRSKKEAEQAAAKVALDTYLKT
jgi:ribonuclease-3